jgi:hypothetical protein
MTHRGSYSSRQGLFLILNFKIMKIKVNNMIDYDEPVYIYMVSSTIPTHKAVMERIESEGYKHYIYLGQAILNNESIHTYRVFY